MDDAIDDSRGNDGMALAARLRRISERLDRDGARAYAAQGIPFEQRWYGVLHQIIENGPLSIGEIATRMRVTHISVSKAGQSLEKAGYVTSSTDDADLRRRRIGLTAAGHKLVADLTPFWAAFNGATAQLSREAGEIVMLLDRLEDALDARSMFDRIANMMDEAARA